MRLDKEKAIFLKRLIKKILPESKVYLFGSRVYDNKKGGDIDILILGKNRLSFQQKVKIEMEFVKKFGEQKIDIVSYTFTDKNIFKEIIKEDAVEL